MKGKKPQKENESVQHCSREQQIFSDFHEPRRTRANNLFPIVYIILFPSHSPEDLRFKSSSSKDKEFPLSPSSCSSSSLHLISLFALRLTMMPGLEPDHNKLTNFSTLFRPRTLLHPSYISQPPTTFLAFNTVLNLQSHNSQLQRTSSISSANPDEKQRPA